MIVMKAASVQLGAYGVSCRELGLMKEWLAETLVALSV
jgi:hypothetical protein